MDLTAGFGLNTIQLAIYGFSVICIEKDPLVFILLKDFLARAGVDYMDVINRISPIWGDANKIIEQVGRSLPVPHVVYLDPMFPGYERRKTKEKKYMQVIRTIVEEEEEYELFEKAMDVAFYKVVIKRPPNLKPVKIMGKAPTYQVYGRGHRFDVYVK